MSAHPLDINAVSEWNTALRSATADGQTVIVDFWATWCGPCKAIAPVYDNLAKQYSWVKFLRVDVDKQQAIAQKYQVRSGSLRFKASKLELTCSLGRRSAQCRPLSP